MCIYHFVTSVRSEWTPSEAVPWLTGGFQDASARVYDVQKASRSSPDDASGSPVTHLHGHTGPIFGVDFSHDQSLLFTASADSTLRLWHLELTACLNLYRSAGSTDLWP